MALTRLCPFCFEAQADCICPEEEPVVPGMRQVPDAQAEMERLAEARKRPPSPRPDGWSAETVTRVKVTDPVTGRSAEAPTESEATGRLIAGLAQDSDDSKESE